jgi:hypothetical protein
MPVPARLRAKLQPARRRRIAIKKLAGSAAKAFRSAPSRSVLAQSHQPVTARDDKPGGTVRPCKTLGKQYNSGNSEFIFENPLTGGNMKSRRLAFALVLISLAILTAGCSSTGDKPQESQTPAASAQPSTEPVLYTGQGAINRMLGLALKWSPDAQPARVESVLTTETTGQNGTATVWRGFFASPSRRAVTTIVCSGSRRPDAPPFGVSTEGSNGAYSADAANLAFLPLLVKTDTDKAFAIAQQHGGEAILKKNAQQTITYVLLKDRKKNVPVWYVIYGTSEKDRKGIGVINATTGDFVSAGK